MTFIEAQNDSEEALIKVGKDILRPMGAYVSLWGNSIAHNIAVWTFEKTGASTCSLLVFLKVVYIFSSHLFQGKHRSCANLWWSTSYMTHKSSHGHLWIFVFLQLTRTVFQQ